jgi:hypothetical protein
MMARAGWALVALVSCAVALLAGVLELCEAMTARAWVVLVLAIVATVTTLLAWWSGACRARALDVSAHGRVRGCCPRCDHGAPGLARCPECGLVIPRWRD